MEKLLIIFLFALIAELIDGGIAMGYGVSLTTLLLSIGIGTAVASASVHMAEVFTTLFSGLSHFKLGNFDKKIFAFLAIPGVIGGVLGAYGAVKFQDASSIRPIISGILLVLGTLIVVKFIEKKEMLEHEYERPRIRHLAPLGFVAAFVDALGGGGWGPITTPTLIMNNAHPKQVIGSVNFAEFFVTLAISITFFLALPKIDLAIVVPMIIGGLIAAPIAARITKKLPHRTVGIMVGVLIMLLSLRTLIMAMMP